MANQRFDKLTSQCIIAVREMLQREFSNLPTDTQIEKYLRFLHADIGAKYQEVIKATARRYVADIFRRLREHGYDPDLMRLWVTGGGGCLVKNFGEYPPDRVIILNDIHANARGYENMAKAKLEARREKNEQVLRTGVLAEQGDNPEGIVGRPLGRLPTSQSCGLGRGTVDAGSAALQSEGFARAGRACA